MNKIGWPAFFHFIEFRSGDDANSQMCRTIWPSPAMAEAAVSDGPHLHHNSKKLNHPQRSCVLIFLFLVIIYGCFSFITFVFSAAFFEKKKQKKKSTTRSGFHNVVLTLHTIVPRIHCHHHPARHLAEKGICSLNRTGTASHRQMFGPVSGCDQGLYQSAVETGEGQASPK